MVLTFSSRPSTPSTSSVGSALDDGVGECGEQTVADLAGELAEVRGTLCLE
jgi:hypothetical protein